MPDVQAEDPVILQCIPELNHGCGPCDPQISFSPRMVPWCSLIKPAVSYSRLAVPTLSCVSLALPKGVFGARPWVHLFSGPNKSIMPVCGVCGTVHYVLCAVQLAVCGAVL